MPSGPVERIAKHSAKACERCRSKKLRCEGGAELSGAACQRCFKQGVEVRIFSSLGLLVQVAAEHVALSVSGHPYPVQEVDAEEKDTIIFSTTCVQYCLFVASNLAFLFFPRHQNCSEGGSSQANSSIQDAEPAETFSPAADIPHSCNDIDQAIDDFLIKPFAHGPITDDAEDPSLAPIPEWADQSVDALPGGNEAGTASLPTQESTFWAPFDDSP